VKPTNRGKDLQSAELEQGKYGWEERRKMKQWTKCPIAGPSTKASSCGQAIRGRDIGIGVLSKPWAILGRHEDGDHRHGNYERQGGTHTCLISQTPWDSVEPEDSVVHHGSGATSLTPWLLEKLEMETSLFTLTALVGKKAASTTSPG
jgi:hypothetical protein